MSAQLVCIGPIDSWSTLRAGSWEDMDGERVHQERITEAMEHQGSHTLLGRVHFYNLCRGQFRNIHGNHDTLVPFDLEIPLIGIYLQNAFMEAVH